jgi:hypothetical protein
MSYLGNSPGVASQRVVSQFTATANQTTFIPTSGYIVGYVDVFLNGTKLIVGEDYTASNGINVVLVQGVAVGDSVEVVSFIPRGLSDGYLKAEADAKYLQLTSSFAGDVSGTYSAITLANSGVTAGSYGSASAIPQLTVDAKGRVTAITTNAVSIPSGSISVTGGDITMSGNTGTSITNATLSNTGVTAGSYGSASAIPSITVDAKGRITSLSTNAVSVPTTLTVAASSGLTENINLSSGQLLLEAGTGVSTITGAGKVTIAIGQEVGTTSNVTFNNVTVNGTLNSDDITAANVTIAGNLTVSGTTTTVNSTTLEVADLNVVLGSGATTAAAANGAGITIGNYANNPTILYGNANNTFAINRGIEVTAPSKITVSDSTSYATNAALSNSDVLYLTNSDQTTTGYVGIFLQHKSDGVALGRIALMGGFWTDPTEAALTFSLRGMSGAGVPVERMRITAGGLVLPGSDNAQDLGSFTARWRNIYTADMHFSNEGGQNSVDGTWGNWTLQEGMENIYMLNNRTGRRYKIVLEEV